jgi:hypothetical protein
MNTFSTLQQLINVILLIRTKMFGALITYLSATIVPANHKIFSQKRIQFVMRNKEHVHPNWVCTIFSKTSEYTHCNSLLMSN